MVREGLDRIDELLEPADTSRGLGAVLAVVTPHARGVAVQARLALAARCVAQRLRQEACDTLNLAAAAHVNPATPADLDALGRRLRRKVRELRLSIELRLPGRLSRADVALQALAASTVLNDTFRGFALTTASRQRVIDAAWVARLEALSALLEARRSPLATLTATCARQGLQCRALAGQKRDGRRQQVAVELFGAFAGAAEALSATRARLASSRDAQDESLLAALNSDTALDDLACLAIGSTPVGPDQRHGALCSLLATALESDARRLVDEALRALDGEQAARLDPIAKLMQAWTRAVCATDPVRQRAARADTGAMPPRLRQAVEACLLAD